MRARSRPDDHVAEAAQRRLEALVAELGGRSAVRSGDAGPAGDEEDPAADPRPDGGRPDPGADEEALGRHARRPLPSSRRAAGWAGDRLPPAVGGLRVDGRHVAVVGVLLVLGLVLAGWTYLQATRGPAGDQEVVVPRASGGVEVLPGDAPAVPGETVAGGAVHPPPSGATDAPPSGATGAPQSGAVTGATTAQVVVDVEGRVRRPGIAVLPAGSRVADALKAAGGARPGVDLRALNLARPLVDGEQLLVGVDPPAGVAAGSLTGPSTGGAPTPGPPAGAAPVALVDLNTADQTALESLPGVGPVTAAAILEWRAQHGAFTSVDELMEVSGIGEATLAEIAPHVTL